MTRVSIMLAAVLLGQAALAQDAYTIKMSKDGEGFTVRVLSDDGEAFEYRVGTVELLHEDEVKGVLQIQEDGAVEVAPPVTARPKVTIGLTTEPVSPALAAQLNLHGARGVLVAGVVDGLAADKAGLQTFDVITSVDNDDLVTQESLKASVSSMRPGDEIGVTVIRRGGHHTFTVVAEPYVERRLNSQVSLDLSVSPIVRYSTDRETLMVSPRVSLVYPDAETVGRVETFETERHLPADGAKGRIRAALEVIKEKVAEIESIMRSKED